MKNKTKLILIIACFIFSTFYLIERKGETIYTFSDNMKKLEKDLKLDKKIKKIINTYKINMDYESKDVENINVEPKDNICNNSENQTELININTADKEILKKLPGVGDIIAENIIKYREDKGGFKDIQEIKNVSRIGDKTFDKIKRLITI